MNLKLLLLALPLSSATYAAPATQKAAPAPVRVYDSADSKKQEPSAVPCPPQKTRTEKLDDLAKMEGEGESHSTNCPAQGTIKETPEKAIH